MRSKLNIEQFEKVLQKLAHEFPNFHQVKTDEMTLDFSYDEGGKPRRLSVHYHRRTGRKDRWGYPETEYWSFTVEPKLYTTSNDATKISFGYKEAEEKIREFIEKTMTSEKPIPRFTLSQRKP
jgi:hypothetical protein